MADYFTHFSCLLAVGTPGNAAKAVALYQRMTRTTVATSGFNLRCNRMPMAPHFGFMTTVTAIRITSPPSFSVSPRSWI